MTDAKSVRLRCSCGCGAVVFEKWEFGDSFPAEYGFSFQNSDLVSGHNSFRGRLRDACKILFGKPIYYAEVSTANQRDMRDFLTSALDIVN